jgi:hypothetical protein
MVSPTSFFVILFFIPFIAVPIGAVWGLIRCIRNRRRPAVLTLIFLGVGGMGLLCIGALSALETWGNLYFYLWGAGSLHWKDYLELLTLPLLLFGGLFLAMEKILSWKTLGLGLALGTVLFFYGGACLFASADYSYTEITSPASVGESHELLFEEKSYFMGGVGTVYEKVSPCFMKKLGDYVLDDGITYVHDGYCHFEWREDGFTLHYGTEAEFEYLQE